MSSSRRWSSGACSERANVTGMFSSASAVMAEGSVRQAAGLIRREDIVPEWRRHQASMALKIKRILTLRTKDEGLAADIAREIMETAEGKP